MFSTVGTILTTILSSYLMFTDGLADRIVVFFSVEEQEIIAEVVETQPSHSLIQLPTAYEYGGSLPDILVRNAQYQQASVAGSLSTAGTSTHAMDESLVNILCTYTTDKYTRTTTGTGFFISHSGVILTNAHVAQFLLLEDVFEEGASKCIVRTGSPAKATYAVELLYISPAWVQKHAELINDVKPKGTGERDYALLYVTATLDNSPIPGRLPYLKPATELLTMEETDSVVTIGGYPAEKIYSEGAKFVPTQKIATTSIAQLLTFSSKYADIVYLRGSSVGAHGASGGPVANADGHAIGLISTKGNEKKLGAGSLNAITISYIDRTILEETGFGLIANTGGDLPFRAKIFKDALTPFLAGMLASEL